MKRIKQGRAGADPDPRPSASIRGRLVFPIFRSRQCPLSAVRFCISITRDNPSLIRALLFRSPDNQIPRSPDLFLRPSAYVPQPTTHPGVAVLLQTKTQVQFDRAVDRTVEAIFHVFQQSNRVQFQPDLSTSADPVGRGSQLVKVARRTIGVPRKLAFRSLG
jgi:hypothetical protein